MVELRQKKVAKETFGYKNKKCAKEPKTPSASRKKVIEEEDRDENKDEDNDEEDEETDASLWESIPNYKWESPPFYHA